MFRYFGQLSVGQSQTSSKPPPPTPRRPFGLFSIPRGVLPPISVTIKKLETFACHVQPNNGSSHVCSVVYLLTRTISKHIHQQQIVVNDKHSSCNVTTAV